MNELRKLVPRNLTLTAMGILLGQFYFTQTSKSATRPWNGGGAMQPGFTRTNPLGFFGSEFRSAVEFLRFRKRGSESNLRAFLFRSMVTAMF
jgi:hypothetical protein